MSLLLRERERERDVYICRIFLLSRGEIGVANFIPGTLFSLQSCCLEAQPMEWGSSRSAT